MRRLAAIACLTASLLGSGCVVQQTQYDQDKIRLALEQLYENQIIDNLIRAANGLPFIQVDYINATSTVTVSETANLGGSEGIAATRQRTMPGAVLALTRALTNTFNYGVAGTNSNQIALTANPAINNNEIYDAYLAFLNVPGSLVVSCDPPPEGKAHVCKRWKGNYFWVPIEFRYLYLKLALITTAQRGKKLLPTSEFFPVTVTRIVGRNTETGSNTLDLKIQGKVPNDIGRIEFGADGKPFHFDVTLYSYLKASPSAIAEKRTEIEDQIKAVRQATTPEERSEAEAALKRLRGELQDLENDFVFPDSGDVIRVTFNPKAQEGRVMTIRDFERMIQSPGGLAGKLYLRDFRPDSTADNMLESLRFQLEQIRLNQLRLQ